jgi:hypothetical protein
MAIRVGNQCKNPFGRRRNDPLNRLYIAGFAHKRGRYPSNMRRPVHARKLACHDRLDSTHLTRPAASRNRRVSHRRRADRRKGVSLAIVGIAALTVLLTTAFHSSNSSNPSKQATAARTAAATLATPDTSADPATPASSVKPAAKRHHVLLVVGDSLIGQAENQLHDASNESVTVKVADELGSAPCDWTPDRFEAVLQDAHPDTVVLAFVGNAGLTGDCVSSKQAYPLTELLSNYRLHLTQLANQATAAGATVIFVNPPARNPGAPPPPDIPSIGELAAPDQFYGFQGVPEIRSLYAEMANGSGGRWHLTDAPALAISPGFVYKQILSCDADDGSCPDGFVQVRKGRDDAIHLDAQGNGAKRYTKALVASAVAIADHYFAR